ncbi:MAG: hypothetical protein SFU85_11470 [Candidatus Methylacidiphilales bacterium]|nr:hypothetical protein [Candidatus Methylacidiphilales bacterium]
MRLGTVLWLSIFGAAGVLPSAWAADAFHEPQIQEIQALHQKSEGGDKKATRDLVEMLETLHQQQPDNRLIQAYLGSAYTLASRDAFPGPGKLDYLRNGLKTMDAAVDADPQNIPVRFIRAVNNFNLPVFINRRDNARADFEVLLAQIKERPDELEATTREAICFFAGLSFKQLGRKQDARATWQSGLDLGLNSDITLRISEEIKKLTPDRPLHERSSISR